MKRIYLDACCLNRPFDDQTQDRIRLEAEAVLLILAHIEAGRLELVGSEVLDFEIEQIPDFARRSRVRLLSGLAAHSVLLTGRIVERGRHLEAIGFGAFDALHAACAESQDADALMTTDDQFLRLANRPKKALKIAVHNPLGWLKEVIQI